MSDKITLKVQELMTETMQITKQVEAKTLMFQCAVIQKDSKAQDDLRNEMHALVDRQLDLTVEAWGMLNL